MPVQKLNTIDGFVVRDFADTPSSGIVRRGRKILQRSATDLARSATYGFAFNGIERGGASAGLNAEGDDEGPALIAFMTELHDVLADGSLELLPAKGIDAAELSAAKAAAGTGTGADDAIHGDADGEGKTPTGSDDGDNATIAGVLAATSWALGGAVDGRRVFVEGDESDALHLHLREAMTGAGATVVDPNESEGKPWMVWATEADAILVGSRPGAMNHQGAELLNVKTVIPWAPIPVTTKALAVMLSRDITYVPDFITASGALVVDHLPDDGSDPAERLARTVSDGLNELATSDDPLFIAACARAETFLGSWQEKLPFGRPLAG